MSCLLIALMAPGVAHAQEPAEQAPSEPATDATGAEPTEPKPVEPALENAPKEPTYPTEPTYETEPTEPTYEEGQKPEKTLGAELGFRVGYGLPFGKSTGAPSDDFDRITGGQVPLWFDLGMHFNKRFSVAMYLSYGIGITSDEISAACAATEAEFPGVDLSCTSSDVRLGVQFLFHILPESLVDPWLGLGTGLEWFSVTQTASAGGQSASSTLTVSGFELVNLQAGIDFQLSDGIGLGPFVTFSTGSFGSAKISCENSACDATSADIANTASHQWLMFGGKFTARL